MCQKSAKANQIAEHHKRHISHLFCTDLKAWMHWTTLLLQQCNKLQARNCIMCHRRYVAHNHICCMQQATQNRPAVYSTQLCCHETSKACHLLHATIFLQHTHWVICYLQLLHCLVYLHLNVMNNVTNSNKIEWTQERRRWRRLCWRQPNILWAIKAFTLNNVS